MKAKEIIFCFSNNNDLSEISKSLKSVTNIDLNISYIELIKNILENKKKNTYIISENSTKGEIYVLLSKILNKNIEYSIWIDEIKNHFLNQKLLEMISFYYSKSLITRTKQMKFMLSKNSNKKIFVIYPWIKEKEHEKKEFSYNIFTNFDLKLIDNWRITDSLKEADISILKLENKTLLYKLPKIIINSIEERLPTVIIYSKPKTVNKIFKYVKNIHVVSSEEELDFYNLEYLSHQSYKFKIPKKLRFKYNLSNFKKILK
jgi:hypothetical protein